MAPVLDTLPVPPSERAPGGRPAAATRGPREALLGRIAEDPHLPSPPGVVLQVLEKASRLDCSPAELAALIHRDPALCGKILKAVNSALYGLSRTVTSIDRAVALLGLKMVRSLVLSLSLPAMQRQSAGQLPLEAFWKESVAGAIVAQELSSLLRRPNPEDDLVAGLLRDLGVLALRQACPADYARVLARPAEERAHSLCRIEEEMLGVDHAEVSAFLLRRWRLPEDISEAVRHHHAPEQAASLPRPVAERARLLYFAGRVAQLQQGTGEAQLLRDILAFGREHYDLTEEGLSDLLKPVARKTAEFAGHMNIEIGACDDYPRIIARAAEELVKLTVETSADQLRILEQKHRAEQEKEHWREQADRLRHEAVRDALTGAFNRGCFEVELGRHFRRARRRGTVLGLIFLDLDDFKTINDCCGHPFGDRVLRETADKLFAAVRHGDVVARYGGDEFCVLVENTSPENLRSMADRLWKGLNDRTVREDSHTAVLRASIGAALCLPRSYPLGDADFLAEADRAMYAAKTTGKNQVALVSLLSEADVRFVRAVEARLFGAWLAENGLGEPRSPGVGMRRAAARFVSPGRLARGLGWLSDEQLRPILHEQRATRRPFDEIALQRGALSQGQLHALLALQLEPPEDLAANLVNQGAAGEIAMRENLRKYYEWLSAR